MKVQIEQRFRPDYLLVDSRTGLTDAGGICTVHLADLLVIVSGLNRQNVEGTSIVLRNLTQAREDLRENVQFVISPVPLGEEKLKQERLREAAARFAASMGAGDSDLLQRFVTVPYHPQIALTEDCFLLDYPDSPLSSAFRRLAERIRDRNPGDVPKTFGNLMTRLQRGDPEAAKELLVLADSDRAPPAARRFAALMHMERGDTDRARSLLERNPPDADSFFLIGLSLQQEAEKAAGAEADRLFELAGQKYDAALQIKPDKHEALNNWGLAISAQATTKAGAEADRLFELAGERLLASERLREGSGAYNLACIAALRGDPIGCRRWLERSRAAGQLPQREHLQTDPDLESIRAEAWFAELVGPER